MSKRSLPSLELLLLPFCGGDNEDEGNQGGDGGQQQSTNQNDSNDDDDDDDDDELRGLSDNQRRVVELSRESGKHRRERNAARKEAAALRKELEALKNGKGDEQQNWETEKAELMAQMDEMRGNVSNTALRSAIMAPDSKYSWYDVPVVMGLVDREAVEIDIESGEVLGLEIELKRIAKEKPYLVKKGTTSGGASNNGNGGSGNGNGGAGPSGSTGSNPNGRNSSNDAKAAQRAQLERQYPSLNF